MDQQLDFSPQLLSWQNSLHSMQPALLSLAALSQGPSGILTLVTNIVSDTFPAEFSLLDKITTPQTVSDSAYVPWQQVGDAFNNIGSREELNTIASKPARDHVFRVNNFEALKTIQSQLQEKIFAIEGELRFCTSGTAPEAAPHPKTHIPL